MLSHRFRLALLTLVAACTPPQVAGESIKPVSNAEAFEGVSCSAVRPQTEPDLMGWDPGSRLNLKRIRSEGVVAVRYVAEGCNVKLELLSNCVGKGSYKYTPYSANEHKVAHNANELFALLPIGAASLTGKVKGDRALRTDYMLVGQYSLPLSSTFTAADLKGPDCARATHVVSAVYAGGFALVSGEERSLDAAATVFGVGAGASQIASAERLADEGNAEACKSAQDTSKPNERCDVPLRIGLLELERIIAPVAPPAAVVVQAAVAPPPVVVAPPTAAPPPAAVRAVVAPSPAPTPAPRLLTIAAGGDMVVVPEHGPVASFSIDRTEVTVVAYAACVKAGKCVVPAQPVQDGAYCNWGKDSRANNPINCVDWNEATMYCAALGKRLPTEQEWVHAASGTDGRTYPWGNEEPSNQACWNRLQSQTGTCPVGAYPAGASPYGALDMAGNVWEWTSSDYGGRFRIYRGGGWDFGLEALLRAASRGMKDLTHRYGNLGFRCAR